MPCSFSKCRSGVAGIGSTHSRHGTWGGITHSLKVKKAYKPKSDMVLLGMDVSKLAIEELKGELLHRDLSISLKIKIDLVIRLSFV